MARWILWLSSLLAVAGAVGCSDESVSLTEPAGDRVTASASASISAPSCPKGWSVYHQGIALVVCRKSYQRGSNKKSDQVWDYVQIVNLKAGAGVDMLYRQSSEAINTKNGKWSPRFVKKTAGQWWAETNGIEGRVCVVSGVFFKNNDNDDKTTELSYPLKHRSILRTTGTDLNQTGSRLVSIRSDEIWVKRDDSLGTTARNAVDKALNEANMFITYPPGWVLDQNPLQKLKGSIREGRTYVGIQDSDDDGPAETVVFYSSPRANESEAKGALGEIGYRDQNLIQLDGGPSTQLYCKDTAVVNHSDNRIIPQAFLITDAPNRLPNAFISAPRTEAKFTAGTAVRFTGTASDPEDGNLPGSSLIWTSNRNGRIGTGNSFTNSNLSVGAHTIELTATDSRGATGKSTVGITIEPQPNRDPTATIQAPANGSTVEVGQAVTFTGSASDPEDGALTGARLVWSSNRDGQIGTNASFTKNNLTEGTHTITLVATDSDGGKGSATINLVVRARTAQPTNQPPVPSIFEPDNGKSFVKGAAIQFQGGAIDPEDGPLSGGSLVWTSSTSGQIGIGASFPRSDLSVGTHTITLRATDSKGVSGQASVTITVTDASNRPPAVSIQSPTNGSSVTQGASVEFRGSAQDPEDGPLAGTSLVWSSSRDGQLGTGPNPTRNNLSVGVHTITLVATDSRGATGQAQVTLTVASAANQPPVPSLFEPDNGKSFVQGAVIQFQGGAIDPEDGALSGGSLVWTSSINGQIGTGATFTRSDLSVGTHTITLRATDSRGAAGSASVTIAVNPPELPDLTVSAAGPSTYTAGQTGAQVQFTVNRSGGPLTRGTYVTSRLYWSTDSQWSTGDQQLWESNGSTPDFPNSVLNSSGSKTVVPTFNIPQASAGTYYILAVADADGYHQESNENNNVTPYAVTLQSAEPPAARMTISGGGQSVSEGGTLSATAGASGVITFSMDASRSTTASGASITSYEWRSNGTPIGSQRSISFGLGAGTHVISLSIQDSRGLRSTASATVNVSAALPDLTASAAVASTYTAGQTGAQVQFTVNRSGGPLTRGTYVTSRLYWSTDSQWSTGDQQLWESNGSTPDFPNSVLNSSGSKTVVPTFNIPQASAGTYYLLAVADADGYHQESNENNNVTPYAVTLQNAEPPAARMTISGGGQSVSEGGTLSATAGASGVITFSMDASRSTTASGASITSYEWRSNGTPIGSQRSISFGLGAGTHVISLSIQDSRGLRSTASATVNVSAALPDLTASATVAGSYRSSQSGAQVQFTVTRTGGQLTRGTYVTSRLYFSRDQQWDGSDTRLWESNGSTPDFPISVLNSSGSKTVVPTFSIPGVSPGEYYILAIADADSWHEESNEGNNVAAYRISVTGS